MAAAGATIRYPMEGLAAFGLVEVVTKLGAHCRLLRALQADFRAGRYDLVILIDYPGFHVRVAEAAREAGHQGPLLHCAPALGLAPGPGASASPRRWTGSRWCSRSSSDSSAGWGSGASTWAIRWWTGRRWPTRAEARARLGIPAGSRVLGIFPGSRSQEIRRLWQPFRGAAIAPAGRRPVRPGHRRRDARR